MVAFLLPTAMAVIDWLLRGLYLRRPIDQHSAANVLFVFDAIVARVAVFVLGVHAAVLAGLLGLLFGREWAAQIVPLMLGITLISVGNLLPRTRPTLRLAFARSERCQTAPAGSGRTDMRDTWSWPAASCSSCRRSQCRNRSAPA
jgi:hypothetical protein